MVHIKNYNVLASLLHIGRNTTQNKVVLSISPLLLGPSSKRAPEWDNAARPFGPQHLSKNSAKMDPYHQAAAA